MARARKKAASSRGATRSQSRKAPAPAVAEVEVVEEEGGLGMEEGIIVLTTLTLVAAIALIESHLVGVYESGVLF